MEKARKLHSEVLFLPYVILLAQLQGCLVIHTNIASRLLLNHDKKSWR